MKVIHVISGLELGGAEGVLFKICKYAENSSHYVVSLSSRGVYLDKLKDLGVEVYCLPRGSLLSYFYIIYKLTILIKCKRPDVVQTWLYHADLVGGVAARLAGVRKIYWCLRMSYFPSGKRRLTLKFLGYLSRIIPLKIICCAEVVRESHIALGYSSTKMCVIENGVDLEEFCPKERQARYFNLDPTVSCSILKIGMVSRFDDMKDHLSLIHAVQSIVKQGIQCHCYFVGSGSDGVLGPLQQEVSFLNLGNNISFLGVRHDIPDFLNNIDVHILSSKSEGFPNVVLEAAACGTISLASRTGASLEILPQEFLFDVGNVNQLTELLIKYSEVITKDPNEWLKLKKMFRALSKGYSIEIMNSKFHSCWKN